MDWIVHLITAAAMAFLFWFGDKQFSETLPLVKGGRQELRMNEFYKWIGYAPIIICGIVISMAFSNYKQEDLMWIGLTLVLFGGLGFALLSFYKNHMVVFNETSIYVSSWRGLEKNMIWKEVVNAKFKAMSGYLVIYSKNDKLKIHQHMKGLNAFVLKLEEKSGINADQLNLPFQIKR